MAKIADIYFGVDPWRITEKGFSSDYGQVSESIFSLGSEYMGIRGFFDEGYGGEGLPGSYFNGIYERREGNGLHYKGIVKSTEYMVNSVNWLHTRITACGETLDLGKSRYDGFERSLDLRNGLLSRSFVWTLADGKRIKLLFERFISMERANIGAQRITAEALNFSGNIEIVLGLDFSLEHRMFQNCAWECSNVCSEEYSLGILGVTKTTRQRVWSGCRVSVAPDGAKSCDASAFNLAARKYTAELCENKPVVISKLVANVTEKSAKVSQKTFSERCDNEFDALKAYTFDSLAERNKEWWGKVWDRSDIVIDGDEMNQQGIRYCIFQMLQTYHGAESGNNIGAKGLTGEAYNGNSFWDTEAYCLPFYIFNNTAAARNLLEFRYLTLPEACERAAMLDCKGAFYPIATISGRECCDLWQHASLQLQASTAVIYGIWMYEKLTGDSEFLREKGLPIMVEVCRMLASRGEWTHGGKRFGYYCVMGPDEFQMMVNHNCYTNYMARFCFDYTLKSLESFREEDADGYGGIVGRTGVTEEETAEWERMSERMFIPYDKKTNLFEQHSGYFELPHVDIDAIPTEEFPLYSHWSYDRIYRNDMIKQPDVLMLMLMFNSSFTEKQIKSNYEFYEPRCIHESSLSPSVHSILAAQLGKHDEAYRFFGFATRLDLDNYNRNTEEGLHTTSIAGAWMNIVYGFGGMRSDGDKLSFAPSIPGAWNGYSFRIVYGGEVIIVKVNKETVSVRTKDGGSALIRLYGKDTVISKEETTVKIPGRYKG